MADQKQGDIQFTQNRQQQILPSFAILDVV
jgi:hypothetical protein